MYGQRALRRRQILLLRRGSLLPAQTGSAPCAAATKGLENEIGFLRRGLRFGLLGLLVAGATLTFAASWPASSGTLDQQQTNAPNDGIEMNGTLATAQVFTPTLSGQLGQVDVLLNRVDTPLGPLSVQIWATASGVP